jgi:hypothetical protein
MIPRVFLGVDAGSQIRGPRPAARLAQTLLLVAGFVREAAQVNPVISILALESFVKRGGPPRG